MYSVVNCQVKDNEITFDLEIKEIFRDSADYILGQFHATPGTLHFEPAPGMILDWDRVEAINNSMEQIREMPYETMKSLEVVK